MVCPTWWKVKVLFLPAAGLRPSSRLRPPWPPLRAKWTVPHPLEEALWWAASISSVVVHKQNQSVRSFVGSSEDGGDEDDDDVEVDCSGRACVRACSRIKYMYTPVKKKAIKSYTHHPNQTNPPLPSTNNNNRSSNSMIGFWQIDGTRTCTHARAHAEHRNEIFHGWAATAQQQRMHTRSKRVGVDGNASSATIWTSQHSQTDTHNTRKLDWALRSHRGSNCFSQQTGREGGGEGERTHKLLVRVHFF